MSAGSYLISREALAIRLARAEEEIEALRQENANLRGEARFDPPDYPTGWGLTRAECLILSALMANGHLTKRKLVAATPVVWSAKRCTKNAAVHICRMREKLRPLGVEITNQINVGYSIPPAHKAIILREIEAASLPAVLAAMVAGRQGASA